MLACTYFCTFLLRLFVSGVSSGTHSPGLTTREKVSGVPLGAAGGTSGSRSFVNGSEDGTGMSARLVASVVPRAGLARLTNLFSAVMMVLQLSLFSVAEAHPEARQQQPVSGRAVGGGQDGAHHAGVRREPVPAVAAAQHDPGRLTGPPGLSSSPPPGQDRGPGWAFLGAAGLHVPLWNPWLFKRSTWEPVSGGTCGVTDASALRNVSREALLNLCQRGGEGGCFLCVSDTVAQCKMPYEAHWHWEGFCQRLYGLRVWALVWVCCSELGGALLWKGGRVTVQSECLVPGKREIQAHSAWKSSKTEQRAHPETEIK